MFEDLYFSPSAKTALDNKAGYKCSSILFSIKVLHYYLVSKYCTTLLSITNVLYYTIYPQLLIDFSVPSQYYNIQY